MEHDRYDIERPTEIQIKRIFPPKSDTFFKSVHLQSYYMPMGYSTQWQLLLYKRSLGTMHNKHS